MTLIGETAGGGALPEDLIKEGSDASFMADVVEASRTQPVIVDFWATWCGPCRQLTPALEKAVKAAKGAVKLVKIDVDKNPAYSGQLRVQSIPTVYAFKDGRPVDGFMGAVPDSQIKAFIDKLTGNQDKAAIEELLAQAQESLKVGDVGGAAQGYAQVLEIDPENPAAIGGLAKAYLQNGDAERAREVLEMAPEGAKHADLDSVRAALALAAEGAAETAEFDAKLAADPADHATRLELAGALAGQGRFEAAMDHLFQIIEADPEWNEGAARAQLLKVMEAAGLSSELSRRGRRRLSSLIFT